MSDACLRCDALVDRYDPTGAAWCEACADRCDLVCAGYERDFREMKGKTFSIGAGAESWRGFAKGATPELVARVVTFLGRPPRPEVWGPAAVAAYARHAAPVQMALVA